MSASAVVVHGVGGVGLAREAILEHNAATPCSLSQRATLRLRDRTRVAMSAARRDDHCAASGLVR